MLHENFGNAVLRRAVRVALTGGTLAATCTAVHAQTVATTTAASNEPVLAEVVVTGSRIAVPNQVSISPVTFVSALDIQQTGAVRIEDMLNSLPQVFASQGSNIVNGSDGTATVNDAAWRLRSARCLLFHTGLLSPSVADAL